MIEIQIINIPSLFWKHNTFLAVYCTLGIYLKPKKKTKKNSKTNKQTKQNKKEKKEGRREKEGLSRIWTRYLWVDPTSHSHYAFEDDHMIWWKASNLMPFSWNFRRQTIEPYLTDWKKQSDEIKDNWNQATRLSLQEDNNNFKKLINWPCATVQHVSRNWALHSSAFARR